MNSRDKTFELIRTRPFMRNYLQKWYKYVCELRCVLVHPITEIKLLPTVDYTVFVLPLIRAYFWNKFKHV